MSLVGPDDDVKIFNSAEKIFELCDHQPVGLMIYNNIDVLRAPLEILAREFRAQSVQTHKTLFECAEAFIAYLHSFAANNISAPILRDAIVQRLNAEFESIRKDAMDIFMNQQGVQPGPKELQLDSLKNRLARYTKADQIDSHKNVTWQDAYAAHKDAVDEAIKEAKTPSFIADAAEEAMAQEVAARSLLTSELSGNLTGLVIAGYGSEGIYPSILAHEIDGFICGRFRMKETKRVEIVPGVQSVDIITFAQEDISKRLLDGVDPEIVSSVQRQLLGGLLAMRDKALANVSAADQAQVNSDYNAAAVDLIKSIRQTVDQFISKCNGDFHSTVAGMPKQEMAFFAEALVNTTAMKRRVSKDREDVGGPVDVAVISRHEGFVWVKRKHYFEPDRNPRFFAKRGGGAWGNGGNNDGPKD